MGDKVVRPPKQPNHYENDLVVSDYQWGCDWQHYACSLEALLQQAVDALACAKDALEYECCGDHLAQAVRREPPVDAALAAAAEVGVRPKD